MSKATMVKLAILEDEYDFTNAIDFFKENINNLKDEGYKLLKPKDGKSIEAKEFIDNDHRIFHIEITKEYLEDDLLSSLKLKKFYDGEFSNSSKYVSPKITYSRFLIFAKVEIPGGKSKTIVLANFDARKIIPLSMIEKRAASMVILNKIISEASNCEFKIKTVDHINISNGKKKKVQTKKSEAQLHNFELNDLSSSINNILINFHKRQEIISGKSISLDPWIQVNVSEVGMEVDKPFLGILNIVKEYYDSNQFEKAFKEMSPKYASTLHANKSAVSDNTANFLNNEIDRKLEKDHYFEGISFDIDYNTNFRKYSITKKTTKGKPNKVIISGKIGELLEDFSSIHSKLKVNNFFSKSPSRFKIIIENNFGLSEEFNLAKSITCYFKIKEENNDIEAGDYIFVKGKWYKLETDLIERLEKAIGDICKNYMYEDSSNNDEAVKWVSWNFNKSGMVKYNENSYNIELSAANKKLNFICLDRNLVSFGGYNKLELCDILNVKHKELFCVKKLSSSSAISHLIYQAKNTSEFLKDTRKLVVLQKEIQNENKEQKIFDISDFKTIVLVIVSENDLHNTIESFPFFTRLSLVDLFTNTTDGVKFKLKIVQH